MKYPRLSNSRWHLLGAAVALNAWSVPSHAVEPDNFRLNSTGDLVALCSADPSGPDYVAAIHFCHGFASGAYQYYQSLAEALPEARYVCVPEPVPSRSQAIAGFVEWSKRNPGHTADKPVDSIFRYLSERYPCASATASR
jgi:hypothetical protein